MTIAELRLQAQAYLNDKKVDNRLIGYEDEYSLEDVIRCANLALTEINGKTIYKTSFTIDTCDPYLMLMGTVKYLLSSEIALKSRNYITVNDGGASVNREGNIELYYRMYEAVKSEFLEQLEAMKFNMNLMGGYGH